MMMEFETARNMMGGNYGMMMLGMWLTWILLVILVVLGILALIKYLQK